jgi:hypothetical protein
LNVNSSNDDPQARVRLFCKPVAYDLTSGYPTLDVDIRAAFLVNKTDGKLHVYTGTGWGELSGSPAFPTDQSRWLGFLVTLDYSAKLWDIYYTNALAVDVRAGFLKLNGFPLTMKSRGAPDDNAELAKVTVSSGTSAYVDEFSLDRAYSELVAGVPSQANVQYVASVVIQSGMAAREILKYFDSTSDGLNQECGAALADAIGVGGVIRVYDAVTGWGVYSNQAGAGWVWISGPVIDDVHLTRTTGLWITTTRSGTVTVARFAPFADPLPTSKTLYANWNMLSWPKTARLINSGGADNLGLSPVDGARLYIYRAGQPYLQLTYRVGTGWRAGSGAVVYTISQEQGMWYWKPNSGTFTWNPGAL